MVAPLFRYAALFLVAASAAILGGCGGSSGPSAFLAQASDGAAFAQWTRSGDSVTGSLTIAHRESGDTGYAAVEKEGVSFTGIIDGSSVTLTLDQGLGFSTNWNGTLDGDELTLSYASEDGSLRTLHFKSAKVEDYNEAVADLQQSVAAANDDQAQLDAEQAQAEAEAAVQADAAQQTDNLSTATAQDLADLAEHVGAAQSDLAAVPKSLRSEQDALDTTHAALQKTLASGRDDICYEAGIVDYEAGVVDYEKGVVEYDLDQLNSDLASVDEDLARLSADFTQLQAALDALPQYRPEGIPSEQEVADARAAAQATVADIVETGRSYRKKASTMVQTAQGYAAQAQRACGE